MKGQETVNDENLADVHEMKWIRVFDDVLLLAIIIKNQIHNRNPDPIWLPWSKSFQCKLKCITSEQNPFIREINLFIFYMQMWKTK